MLDFIKKFVLVNKTDTSVANTLNTTDVQKIVRETLVAAASAALTVLINYEGSLNLGSNAVILAPIIHFVLTSALKYVKDNGSTTK